MANRKTFYFPQTVDYQANCCDSMYILHNTPVTGHQLFVADVLGIFHIRRISISRPFHYLLTRLTDLLTQ